MPELYRGGEGVEPGRIESDAVNHPQHYTAHPSGVECIQITEHMGFNLGNAVKYIWRADLKDDALEDLRKAAWYVNREIDRLEKADTEQQLNLAQAGPRCMCWCPDHRTRGCACPCTVHTPAELNPDAAGGKP